MAIIEERNDNVSYIEVRLKFWKYDAIQQM